jgi:nucleoside-diphosphate-sugar epimerase
VEPRPIDETHPIAPTSLYGAAKAAAHLCGCALARELGIDFVTLRPFGVFGPGEAPHRFVPYLARALARGESPQLTPGGQARDWIYADDAAEAFASAATASLEPYTAYNVCTGRALRVRDVALMVAQELNVDESALGLGAKPYRPDEPLWVVGDPTRFTQATGWSARVDVREGVGRTVRWALSEAAA